eukprot:CAMPEP_0181101792 /NCGR_PEP_ID=MMETSP1071-20121207/13956_1 /TAXON_ID=35127 /ORGANISM="Thalassiosira sp., Strain NH16" /LENGTH=46 /DNA_ID= /DNA_START= /DNA_END= /DNA_ORIENTATION=
MATEEQTKAVKAMQDARKKKAAKKAALQKRCAMMREKRLAKLAAAK